MKKERNWNQTWNGGGRSLIFFFSISSVESETLTRKEIPSTTEGKDRERGRIGKPENEARQGWRQFQLNNSFGDWVGKSLNGNGGSGKEKMKKERNYRKEVWSGG